MKEKLPIRRIPKEKVAILHVYEQREQIAQLIKNTDKLSVIITGNGNPQDGYMYKVDEMGRDVREINNKLTDISGIVTELHKDSIGEKASGKSASEIRAEKRARLNSILKTASFIVAALALCMTAYFSYNSDKKIGKPQDTLTKEIRSQEGVSKVSRGGFVKYNDNGLSDSIKVK